MEKEGEFLSMTMPDLQCLAALEHKKYIRASPFPYGCFDNWLNPDMLRKIVAEFPELGSPGDLKFNNPNEHKLASRGAGRFGTHTTALMNFLNSQPFLEVLSSLTGITGLIPDPYYWGGGLHEIKKGGYLKIHTDFNRHPELNLDRRLNLLVYLNEDWKDEYGGQFELWDKKMENCVASILPVFNRMVVFSTTDFSFHGHPNPLTCPEDRSRRSLALYYYTNGRPKGEVVNRNQVTTQFRSRKFEDSLEMKNYNRLVNLVTDLMPPMLLKLYKRWAG